MPGSVRAVEAIRPVPYPTNHQAIRVIREEVERIEWALTEITPGR
jgi:Ni,Fe-hydrogenase III large subunit